MKIFPAIDLIGGNAVRLKKGDYGQVTVYGNDPRAIADGFLEKGAEWLHVVDLDGAKDGSTANFETVKSLAQSGLDVEIGGGIRSMDTIERYMSVGVKRVILGTAAVCDKQFLNDAVKKYGEAVAVGVDILDGMVAIKGWKEISDIECFEFCRELEAIGIKTVICTDISKDGMLGGTNIELYKRLSESFKMNFVASGGVSSIDDIKRLSELGMYAAIVGKAIYTGDLDLKEALAAAKRG